MTSYREGLNNPVAAHAVAVMRDEGYAVPDLEQPSQEEIGQAYRLAIGALGVEVDSISGAELHPDGSRRE